MSRKTEEEKQRSSRRIRNLPPEIDFPLAPTNQLQPSVNCPIRVSPGARGATSSSRSRGSSLTRVSPFSKSKRYTEARQETPGGTTFKGVVRLPLPAEDERWNEVYRPTTPYFGALGIPPDPKRRSRSVEGPQTELTERPDGLGKPRSASGGLKASGEGENDLLQRRQAKEEEEQGAAAQHFTFDFAEIEQGALVLETEQPVAAEEDEPQVDLNGRQPVVPVPENPNEPDPEEPSEPEESSDEETDDEMARPAVSYERPKNFRGSHIDDPTAWMERSEIVATHNRWLDGDKVANFPLYLEGAAAYWHSAKDPPDHWEDIAPRVGEQGPARMGLKNAFLEVFHQADYRRYQEVKLNARTQVEDEDLLVFYYWVLDLCKKIDPDSGTFPLNHGRL